MNKNFLRDGDAQVALPLTEKKLLTLRDMAIMFSVSLRTIYNWLNQSRFSYVKVGSKTYITEQQLSDFLAGNEIKSFKGRRA